MCVCDVTFVGFHVCYSFRDKINKKSNWGKNGTVNIKLILDKYIKRKSTNFLILLTCLY